MNTNDLIGLKYGWGYAPGDGSGQTDCFQLACEVHKRLGFADYTAQFAWVYADYQDETFPRVKIARWLLENGHRLNTPKTGAIVLLPGSVGAALGTVMEDGTTVFIGPNQTVIRLALPVDSGNYFWMNK